MSKDRLMVKSVKISSSLSQETLAYTCKIYFDGKAIGETAFKIVRY